MTLHHTCSPQPSVDASCTPPASKRYSLSRTETIRVRKLRRRSPSDYSPGSLSRSSSQRRAVDSLSKQHMALRYYPTRTLSGHQQSSRCSSSNSMASESPFSPVPLQLRTTSSVSSTIISSANTPSKSNPLNSSQGHTTLPSRMLPNSRSFLEDDEDDIKDVRSSEDQGDVRNSNFSYFDSFCTTLRSNSLLHSSPPSPLPSPNSSPFTSPLNRVEDESPVSSCESSPYGAKVFGHSQLPKFRPLFASDIHHAKRNLLSDLMTDIDETLTIVPQTQKRSAADKVFSIPEILEIILKYTGSDDQNKIPREHTLTRRPPQSYRHAVLIHGPEEGAKVWRRSISNSSISSCMNPRHCKKIRHANLYNCMLVNHLWFSVTREILNENVFFESDNDLAKFCTTNKSPIRCKTFVLHKLRATTQYDVDCIATNINPINLKWVEFYICPKLLPPPSLFTPAMIKLSLPGCRCLSDDNLIEIVKRTPNLKTLDLRASEMITDASLYQVAQNCPHLETLNVGRHLKGDLVSDYSICPLIRKCQIKTLGVAGCGISDRTIWELGLLRGDLLERLSVNHCMKLRDVGICQALRRDIFKRMSVLEIRGVRLNDFRAIVEFKKRQLKRNIAVLIETSEYLEARLRDTELQMDLEISNRIFSDIVDWLNEDEDEDDRNYELFKERRQQRLQHSD
ncbi:hypothetical protein HII13_001318 [Brettanomyces bruxellensis]|nr:hypothetical protein HII13_001318 [Brettanomyces bruxellensis]